MIPMLGITKHHDLLNTKAVNPEGMGSKVVTEKHILLSTIVFITVQVACDISKTNP